MASLFGEEMERDALISPCGKYRYSLLRKWKKPARCVNFIILNPSIADGKQDDPTIRRCVSFARSWGYDGIIVTNLFAFRATDPKELLAAQDPVGPCNDDFLRATECPLAVAAWGASVPLGREDAVLKLLSGVTLHCLERTKHGKPRHPLYCKSGLQPLVFLNEKGL